MNKPESIRHEEMTQRIYAAINEAELPPREIVEVLKRITGEAEIVKMQQLYEDQAAYAAYMAEAAKAEEEQEKEEQEKEQEEE